MSDNRFQRLDAHTKAVAGDQVTESPRTLSIRGHYDVAVCGGGPAGAGAAIAAGRAGAKVIMIERWGMPGGMWTAGLVNPFFEWRDRGYVVADLTSRLETAGAFTQWCGSYCFSPEVMKLILEEMLVSAGVELLYYSLVVDAVVVDARVVGVVVESKAGREAVMADVVVDATGDGDVAARAGCRFEFGRSDDGLVQPMTLMFEIRNTSGYFKRDSRGLFDQFAKALGDDSSLPFIRGGAAPYIITLPDGDGAAVQATHVYRLNPLDPSDLTRGTVDARRQVHELLRLLRRMPGFEEVEITSTGSSIGIRESRRVLGQYWLTVDDLREGRSFEDAVCSATFPVDVHEPSPGSRIERGAAAPMKPYDIPYRSLLPADVRGLLLAGRCISGDHLAHASYRVSGTMIAVGQAAGLAAAEAASRGCDPSDIDGQRLHLQLVAEDCKFVRDGVKFNDGWE